MLRGRSVFIANNFNAEILQTVHSLVADGQADMIHCNHIDTVQCVTPGTCPYFVDTHNVMFEYFARRSINETSVFKKAFFSWESKRLREYELRSLKPAHGVIVCSEQQKAALLNLGSKMPLHVAPNGVDCSRFSTLPDNPFDRGSTLVFVGDMGYAPNNDGALWMIEAIMPAINARLPDVRLQIVGRNPSRELRWVAEAFDNIEVTGEVDEANSYLQSAKAIVVPLRCGSGMRLKVVEAMASGVPLISTCLGAEGVGCVDGIHVLFAEKPLEFASACVFRCMPITDSGESRSLIPFQAGHFLATTGIVHRVRSEGT